MMDTPTWTQAVAQAEHRIAIGATDVYLGSDAATFDSLDWSKCVSMETGGSHRLDIATSVIFRFEDKGISGRWHFDIEPHSANGSNVYEIDVAGIQRILVVLPPSVRRAFMDYLTSCETAVLKRAYGMAWMLRRASRAEAPAAGGTTPSPKER